MTPEVAVLEALIAHLATELGQPVRRGWPREPQGLDEAPVVAAYLVGAPRFAPVLPYALPELPQEDGSALLPQVWAEGSATLHVEVIAGYQATRDTLAAQVDAALDNQLPHAAGLRLGIDYHGQTVPLELVGSDQHDDADSHGVGEWTAQWVLRAALRRIKTRVEPRHPAGGAVLLVDVD